MKAKLRYICNKCDKVFSSGNRPDGVPNGVAVKLKDGRIANFCADCIMSFSTEEGKKWLDAFKENK